jgi:uroporphyrinogen-III synthase
VKFVLQLNLKKLLPHIWCYIPFQFIHYLYNVGNKLASFLFQLVAIGPTTAEAALSEYKLKVWSVASKPTSEHLLEAVLKL